MSASRGERPPSIGGFVGSRLQAWRLREGFASQAELGVALGYTRTVVTHIETGKLQPSPRFIIVLDALLEKIHARKGRPGTAPVSRDLFYNGGRRR